GGAVRVQGGGGVRRTATVGLFSVDDQLVRARHGAVGAAADVTRAADVVVARLWAGARIAGGDRGVAGLAGIDAPIAATRAGGRAAVVVGRPAVHDARGAAAVEGHGDRLVFAGVDRDRARVTGCDHRLGRVVGAHVDRDVAGGIAGQFRAERGRKDDRLRPVVHVIVRRGPGLVGD